MGDLSKNFSRHEFSCSCGCGFDTVDAELLDVLQSVRDHFGKPVKINSACRCDIHNLNVGGTSNSQHRLGRAADIDVSDISPTQVQAYLIAKYPYTFGIGVYDNFTHIDTRTQRARW